MTEHANPYTTADLVRFLRHFWEKAEGINYDHEHEVMRCAADEIERLEGLLAYASDTDAYRKLRTENERLQALVRRYEARDAERSKPERKAWGI